MKVTFYLSLTSKEISYCRDAAYRVIYTGKLEIVRKCWNCFVFLTGEEKSKSIRCRFFLVSHCI